jgi:hypothetical protein
MCCVDGFFFIRKQGYIPVWHLSCHGVVGCSNDDDDDDTCAEFRDLLTNLTLYHGDSKFSVHPETTTEEEGQHTLGTLQRAGMLGLMTNW